MTAFARAESDGIVWEVRSVNQRYLDVNLKIPESFRFLEPTLKEMLRGKIQRGKFPEATPPNTLDLLQWPGVLEQKKQDKDVLGTVIAAVFADAAAALSEMRAREGAELERIIREKLEELSTIVTAVRGEVAVIQERQQQRIRDRIAELQVDVDQGRLEQELVYQAQKSDVAEELDRLETHVTEVLSTLDSKKPSGRRLDFLMQELNREANTLSSKAIAANTTIAAVELKVIIEQMREQVQNIE
jgi:uncharacterized protein (TIGR00255 family)